MGNWDASTPWSPSSLKQFFQSIINLGEFSLENPISVKCGIFENVPFIRFEVRMNTEFLCHVSNHYNLMPEQVNY